MIQDSTAELTQDLFVRNRFAAIDRSAGPLDVLDCFRREFFVVFRSARKRFRERLDENIEKIVHGRQFVFRKSVDEQMSVDGAVRRD